jgi:hypothetical protein
MSRATWKTGVWSWYCPVYSTNYVLLRCEPPAIADLVRREVPDPATQQQILKGFDPDLEGVNGRYVGCHSEAYKTVVTIWLRPSSGIPIIVHEIIHALTDVLVGRGLRLAPDSDEAFAYYAEWLLREIFDCLAVAHA